MFRQPYIWLLAFIFFSCKKNGDQKQNDIICTLSSVKAGLEERFYDDEGRMISIHDASGQVSQFTYSPGLIVYHSGNQKIHYYLDQNGLADSALSIMELVDDTITTRNRYQYENGYLAQILSVGHFSLPFGQFTDTILQNFHYQDGNLVRISSSVSNDIEYLYHDVEAKGISATDPRNFYQFFFGKASKDLVASMEHAGGLVETYTYLFNAEGYVTNRRTYNSSSSLTGSVDFFYHCQ